mgnify:CR=1 FL=1
MTATYDKIATYTVTGSAQASYTFTNISQAYTDLFVICNLVGVPTGQGFRYQAGTSGTLDTGNNYSYTWLSGNNTAAASGRVSSANQGQIGWAWQGSSEKSSVIYANFQNYSNTTTFKTAVGRTADSGLESAAIVNLWRSTNAITDLRLFPSTSTTMGVGSTLNLYGIKAE